MTSSASISWDKSFKVIIDGSNIAAAKPMDFYIKELDSAQCKYSIYDEELYASVTARKHSKHILFEWEFIIKIGYQALKWLQTIPSADWSDR